MTVYNKASLVLAESPAYKAGKIQPYYPLTPDVSFDFTRATSATRVNADGNIEKETQNLLVQSNTFDTNWTISEGTILGGQTGYDGSTNAWLYTDNVGTISKSHDVRQSVSESGVNCFSIYAKMGTKAWVKMYSGLNTCFFNIDPNYVGNRIGTDNTLGGRIEDVGNGWFRLSIFDNGSTSLVLFGIAGGDNSGNYLSDGTGTIYIQNAQLEQGLVARDYQETTTSAFYGGITDNIPRLDYTDSSCPSVLLEPQRTNLIPHSEGADKTTSSTTSYTFNEIVSPDGYRNSIKIETLTAGSYRSINWSISLSAGAHTFSCYLKAGTSPYIGLYHIGTGLGWIDTSDFTKSSGSLNFDIENFGNGWYKIHYTITATAGNNAFYIFNANGNSQTNSDVGDNFYGYGFQVEEGSYATSYIPTYGTSVTRNADNPTLSNLQSNNIVGDTFSYFFEWGDYVADRNFEIKDSSNTIFLFMVSRLFRYNNESGGVDTLLTLPASGTALKCMVTYDGTTLKGFVNGALEGSVTDAKASQFSDFNFLRLDRDFPDSEELRSLIIFPTALTDDECIALTTL